MQLSDVFAVARNDVWAVGPDEAAHHTTVVRWDGGRWDPLPTPALPAQHNWLTSIGGVGADDLWAAGIAFPGPTDRRSYPIMEHWDGSSWKDVTLPDLGSSQGGLGSITPVSSNDMWAFGWYGQRNLQHPLAEHWDGHRWGVSALPDTGAGLDDLWGASASSADDVWAVGRDFESDDPILVVHWDGRTWQRVHPSIRQTAVERRAGVGTEIRAVLALDRNDVWLAGTGQRARMRGGHVQILGEEPAFWHFDGQAWQSFRAPAGGHELDDLGGSSSADVWAVGLSQTESKTNPVAYHWDGHTWSLGTTPDVGTRPNHMDDFRMNELSSISVLPNGDAWAVGEDFTDSSDAQLPLVERCLASA
ncbi:MAG: hypothetical protein M3Q23_02650 [Actinomycetota bacterium]|nr:hypothetical protein [Actinomycetota bacterium]